MQVVTLARHAMATRFEIVLHGENAPALRAAGEEALHEIDRLEAQLSLYRPASEIARVNANAAREPVQITPPIFALLQHAQQLWRETHGAFDITIAPLVRCWGFMNGTGQMPTPEQIAEAREKIGMQHVVLDEEKFSVRFTREGVMLDLGAIGKGYAIDCAVELLREAGVTSALLHGGTSSIYAIGQPLDADHWNVAIEFPPADQAAVFSNGKKFFARISLENESLAVSAVWARAFQVGGKILGHVLDPRTGRPVSRAVMSAVVLPSATESDALSTALLVLGDDGHEMIAKLRPATRTLVVTPGEMDFQAEARGIEIRRT